MSHDLLDIDSILATIHKSQFAVYAAGSLLSGLLSGLLLDLCNRVSAIGSL